MLIFDTSIYNSIFFEKKTLSEWIEFFKIDISLDNYSLIFEEKLAKIYDLNSIIFPFFKKTESLLKRKFEKKRIEKINEYTSNSKRIPSQEILDSLIREEMADEYSRFEDIKIIYDVITSILSKYETFSYRIK